MSRDVIPLLKVFMPPVDEVLEALHPVLESGWVGEGPKVVELEEAFAKRFDNPHVNAVSTGTMGLDLIAMAIGLGEGDEVITTPLTCSASNLPFARTGAKLVWADVDKETGNIEPYSVGKRVTPNTKAVVVVHWGGYPVDIGSLRQVLKDATDQYIYIIEDAAHANGSYYEGRPVGICNYGLGRHSDFSMFSLQAVKQINSIDGGLVTTYKAEEYEHIRVLRWYGIDRRYRKSSLLGHDDWEIMEIGTKGHMNDVIATIGLVQLSYLDQNLEIRRRNARLYDKELKDVPGILYLPVPLEKQEEVGTKSAYYLYTILVEDREGFIRAMRERSIHTSVVHLRNDTYSVFSKFRKWHLPALDYCDKHQISIPVGHWVTPEDANYITEMIRKGW